MVEDAQDRGRTTGRRLRRTKGHSRRAYLSVRRTGPRAHGPAHVRPVEHRTSIVGPVRAWFDMVSPGAVMSALVGFLLARARLLGAIAPLGLAYLGVIASSRGALTPITALAVLLGMTGPVLNRRTIWPAIPVVLLTVAGRLLSRRRREDKLFALPACVLVLGFAVPAAVRALARLTMPSLPMVALEAAIGTLAAAIMDWGGLCERVPAGPGEGGAAHPERAMAFGLVCAGITMGLAGVAPWGVSVGAVAAGLATVVAAFAGGTAVGTMCGAGVGLACALSGQGLVPVVGSYALGGCAAGALRHRGKLASAAGFLVGAGMLVFQVGSRQEVPVFLGQLALSTVAFLAVPRGRLLMIRRLLPMGSGRSAGPDVHARRVQDLLSRKLHDFAAVFEELSSMLRRVPYDPELAERADIAHVLHKVATSSCSRCRSYLFCWGDAFHRTFRDVLNLVALAELKGTVDGAKIDGDLRRRCIDVPGLVAAVNSTAGSYRQSLTHARRLVEGRQMLSGQLQGISAILKGLGADVWARVQFETQSEDKIARELGRLGLGVTEVSVVERRRGRLEVTVTKGACLGGEECSRAIAPLVSRLIGRDLEVSRTRCGNRTGAPTCEVRLSPARSYTVATSVSVVARDGQAVSGDTHSVLELPDGRVALVLSDGMGAGHDAAMESSTAVSMLERLLEAGFDDEFAVKTVNLILLLRSPGETFATLDVTTVDLVTGEGQFIKVGSPPSFIRRARDVKIVRQASLPAGVFDAITVEKTAFRFTDGDVLVMVSDGVLSSIEPATYREDAVASAIARMSTDEPGQLAQALLDAARKQTLGKVTDDMTVLVGFVRSRHPNRRGSSAPARAKAWELIAR